MLKNYRHEYLYIKYRLSTLTINNFIDLKMASKKKRTLPHLLVSVSVHKGLNKLIPSFDNGGGQIWLDRGMASEEEDEVVGGCAWEIWGGGGMGTVRLGIVETMPPLDTNEDGKERIRS